MGGEPAAPARTDPPAKAQLEAEAAGDPAELDPDGPGSSAGMQEHDAREDTPSDKAQCNFTDGDRRIMPSQDGFIAGYNGQIAVDAAHQVITAHRLSTNPDDFSALVPLIDQTRTNLGRSPREVSGDTGFASEANIAAGWVLKRTPLMQAMAEKIRKAARRSRYRLRKQVVEPVFGQEKSAGGSRQFFAVSSKSEANGQWSAPSIIPHAGGLSRAASVSEQATSPPERTAGLVGAAEVDKSRTGS